MKVYLYEGGYETVKKSGVGKAIEHQKAALKSVGLTLCDENEANDPEVIMQFNTVLPDSFFKAGRAKKAGHPVIYYAHSTMEDFKNSFTGSNLLAPLFKKWILKCYGQGDVLITPSEYSKKILRSYGIKKPIFALSNGIDTDFFHKDEVRGKCFRNAYSLSDSDRVVISVGHWMERKGLPDFVAVAKHFPSVKFLWFGYTDAFLLPSDIKRVMDDAPSNVTFAGFVDREHLRDAYCGADCFLFMSHEETEGIVVLEALACETPIILRDIPVYDGWLSDGENVHKISGADEACRKLSLLLNGDLEDLTGAGLRVAKERSLQTVGKKLKFIYGKLIEAKKRNGKTRG